MSMCISPPRWRHTIPVAALLTFDMPTYSLHNGKASKIYSFDLSYQTGVASYQVPSSVPSTIITDDYEIRYSDGTLVDNPSLPADANGNIMHETYDIVTNNFRFINFHVDLLTTETLKVVTYAGPDDNDYFHIDMHPWLIQGANPYDLSTLSTHNQFQGGYRNMLSIVKTPLYGIARVSPDRLGLDYRPQADFKGLDNFAYKLTNSMGQDSDAACIVMQVG